MYVALTVWCFYISATNLHVCEFPHVKSEMFLYYLIIRSFSKLPALFWCQALSIHLLIVRHGGIDAVEDVGRYGRAIRQSTGLRETCAVERASVILPDLVGL